MRVEWFEALDSVLAGRPDLCVPGLSARLMAGAVLWQTPEDEPSRAGAFERYGAKLVTAAERVSAVWLAPSANCGWASTVVSFPEHWGAYVTAGWVRAEPREEDRPLPWTRMTIWSALPPPGSPEWRRFWSVPLDPVLTNIVVARRGGLAFVPPSNSVMAAPASLSTVLLWPWMRDAIAQERWLASISTRLVGLVLGIEHHRVGVQFVVPRADLDQLHRVLGDSVASLT
jgi:hypothetical protein